MEKKNSTTGGDEDSSNKLKLCVKYWRIMEQEEEEEEEAEVGDDGWIWEEGKR
jgi:hypothetical protein